MKSIFKKTLVSSAIAALVISAPVALAKDAKKDKKKKDKTVAELIKDKAAYEGFLNLYQDEKTGSLMMVIKEEQLNKPMMHFSHTVNGVLDAGHFTGAFRTQKLIEFNKSYDKIEVVTKTNRFKFDENNAISKAKDANISKAILASLKVESYDKKKGEYLVKADELLLGPALDKVSPYPNPNDPHAKKRYKVGKLSKKKTKYTELRNYPQNTDIVVEYVFDNPAPSVWGGPEISDPRSVAVQLQHSFIQLPDNGFKPRRDDPRVGYFHNQFDIMTSSDWANYGDVINRWNLVKKDPTAAISEPVKPITWWIENTTPVEWRETIKNATLAWNEAFESAGFKNAIEVKVQPDDAEWDAGDIRYNVLRWTSSPRPPFGGYGPSIANPMTGEIIAADIMLEFVYLKNRWLYNGLFSDGATMSEMQYTPPTPDALYCSAGHNLQMGVTLANSVLSANGAPEVEKHKMLEQALSELILHEVGHTLGLNHNMKASQLYDAKQVHDASLTQGVIIGSVMDYAPLNIAPPGVKQGDYTNSRPGPYDHWIIEYGYSQGLDNADAEEKRLQQILNRSTEPKLAFGNDADDMRSPGRHIDPRVMIDDLSSQAVDYSIGRFELVKDTFKKLKDKSVTEGESYHDLVMGANVLVGNYRIAAGVVTRYIGGVYIDRALNGQEGATQPYTPVPKELQKHAMDTLSKYVFAPDMLAEAKETYAYLQRERRGFNNYGRNEDPKPHAMLLNIQKNALNHLLHQNVLLRMTDTALYGNEYSLNEMLTDLTDAVFAADIKSDVNTHRQNLQIEYVQRLLAAIGAKSKYDHISKAAISHQLERVLKQLKFNMAKGDTKIHQNYLKGMIEKALSA